MKKIVLSLCILISCCILYAQVAEAKEFYYEEIIEEIAEYPITRATQLKTGKKTVNYKNASGAILWSVTITGTFTYTGSSSTCTSASVGAVSMNNNWKIYSKSSSKSKNVATGKATAKYYLDGSLISTLTKTVTLTCNSSGKLL